MRLNECRDSVEIEDVAGQDKHNAEFDAKPCLTQGCQTRRSILFRYASTRQGRPILGSNLRAFASIGVRSQLDAQLLDSSVSAYGSRWFSLFLQIFLDISHAFFGHAWRNGSKSFNLVMPESNADAFSLMAMGALERPCGLAGLMLLCRQ